MRCKLSHPWGSQGNDLTGHLIPRDMSVVARSFFLRAPCNLMQWELVSTGQISVGAMPREASGGTCQPQFLCRSAVTLRSWREAVVTFTTRPCVLSNLSS